MKHSFERVLKPILIAAETKGDIESVPVEYYNLLENGFQAPTAAAAAARVVAAAGDTTVGEPIPQIVVKFCSRYMRKIVLKNKTAFCPTPNDEERASGYERYRIYEDLTAINYKLLKSAMNDQRILAAWTTFGKLR